MATTVLQNVPNILRHQGNGLIGITCLHPANYSSDAQKLNLAALKRGTGGRSSFNGVVATVFGATGFLGRYVVNKLGKMGSQIIIPYRADHYEALRLKVAGDLGQVLFQPYYLRDEVSIAKAVRYSNVVINLIGRDWETNNFKFDDVHCTGAKLIARISKESGVEKLIHFSALNASPEPEPCILKTGSNFLKSKFHGENAVREEFPEAIIFRPADIYGQEDRFLRMYCHVWRHQFRWMPLWYKGERTIKQPVYCSDVAQGVRNAINDPDAVGKVFQAVGPSRYTLAELLDWFHRIMRKQGEWGYRRYDLRYDPFFRMRVKFSKKISPSHPIGNLHPERLEREHVTDIVQPGVCTLEDLGVKLTRMENQVPWELKPFRFGNYYDESIGEFEKPIPPRVCA